MVAPDAAKEDSTVLIPRGGTLAAFPVVLPAEVLQAGHDVIVVADLGGQQLERMLTVVGG